MAAIMAGETTMYFCNLPFRSSGLTFGEAQAASFFSAPGETPDFDKIWSNNDKT